jgi:ABC-type transport system involved in multi-copper enzyme maturation permease subunit
MSLRRSLVDTLLVARFEVLRAVRTWRALALIVLYVLANAGGAYLFVEILGQVEGQLADQLHVPRTRWPGPLMDQVRQSPEILKLLQALVGDPGVAKELVHWPLLAVFQLWQGFVLVPFLAAAAAAESIAVDVQSRAIRFEALRTGRSELVAGRYLGQLALSVVATLAALASVGVVGTVLMVGQDPLELAAGLLVLGLRAVVFALPFAGIGIACSSLTSSPAWARVLALVAVAGTWVGYGVLSWAERAPWTTVADVLLPLLPQTWLDGLWRPGGALLASSLVCAGIGVAVAGLGYVRFARRDL